MTKITIQKTSIDKLEPNPWNPNELTQTQYQNLVKEIQKRGFLQPILARPLPNGKYQIIDGYHRWKAAKQAGLKKIDTVIIHTNEQTAKILTLNMNHLRGTDDITKLAQIIQDLHQQYNLQQLEQETYITQEELETLLDIDTNINIDIDQLPDKQQNRKYTYCPNCGEKIYLDQAPIHKEETTQND